MNHTPRPPQPPPGPPQDPRGVPTPGSTQSSTAQTNARRVEELTPVRCPQREEEVNFANTELEWIDVFLRLSQRCELFRESMRLRLEALGVAGLDFPLPGASEKRTIFRNRAYGITVTVKQEFSWGTPGSHIRIDHDLQRITLIGGSISFDTLKLSVKNSFSWTQTSVIFEASRSLNLGIDFSYSIEVAMDNWWYGAILALPVVLVAKPALIPAVTTLITTSSANSTWTDLKQGWQLGLQP